MIDKLYADLPDGAWWYIWTLAPNHEKRTHWYNDVALCEAAIPHMQGVNVYYPIAWAAERRGSFKRLEYSDTAGIIGLVSDLDIKHKSFPNEDKAIEAISRLPIQPTACINSGNGLQVIWLFKEPWQFDNEQERQEAQAISTGWGYSIANIVNRMGYEIDAVHDLTRVMRLPGSMNIKDPNNPKPVVIKWFNDELRYNPEDFEPYLADVPAAALKNPLPQVDLSANFPVAKHEVLLENNKDYANTYSHKRKLTGGDTSCSAYDMSLANYTVRAGWTDDEITALLVEHQKQKGDKPDKVHDARYFARTIQAARISVEKTFEADNATATLKDTTTTREERIKALAERWQIPLTNIQVVTGDPAQYRFWIGGRCAEVPATKMITQMAFLGEVYSVSQVHPKPIGSKDSPKWYEICCIIGDIAEVIDAGAEATRDGSLLAMINDFLNNREISDIAELNMRQRASTPFSAEGRIWFRTSDLLNYAKMNENAQFSRRELSQKLKSIGGEVKTFNAQVGRNESNTTISLMGLSEGILAERNS